MILLFYFLQNNHNFCLVNLQLPQYILCCHQSSLMYSLVIIHHILILLSQNQQKPKTNSVFPKLFRVQHEINFYTCKSILKF